MTLQVGQFNLPSRQRYETAMRGIFERRYYTNQGPMTRAFEERLKAFLDVKHVVCVTNATIALMMASEALGIKGRAVVPAIANAALIHALQWCRVEPVFVDVNAADGQLDVEALEANIGDLGQIGAIVGANLWGGACDADTLAAFARARNLPVMFDSSHAFGCAVSRRRIGHLGDAEVFSFDAADILNAAGGACVATADDGLAARLRNIRSSYGAGPTVAVVKTSNGRMSEAQASLGLLSMDDYEANRAHNRALLDVYRSRLQPKSGVRVVDPRRVDISNHQALVCAIDKSVAGLSRDAVVRRLAESGIEAVVVRTFDPNQPVAGRISDSWLRLPLGAHVSVGDVTRVCDIVNEMLQRSRVIRGAA